MDDISVKIFMSEIKHQCRLGAMAYDDITKGLVEHNQDLVWYSVQAFLISIGNISKLLWPGNKKSLDRGKQLRKLLCIDNQSVLRSRKFRNHFEHFDERLEHWIDSTDHKFFIDKNISNKDILNGNQAFDVKHSLRHLITDDMILKFNGENYELKPVADSIIELYKEVIQYEENSLYKVRERLIHNKQ